jgi:hypothetical protein
MNEHKTWTQSSIDDYVWPTLFILDVNGWLATYVKTEQN